ncbi:MAG: AAA family ATPase [Gammaproteobacteria bacterium]|nr:AAA family ATPase [Gammaproteobacteria bacterium]
MTTAPMQAPPLIAGLMAAAACDHPVGEIRLVETHISWVILTGDYAYKIKKPVDLGFLDFSTLDKRRFYCEEELRLNRRLAPDAYLDVLPITGTPEQPVLGGQGDAIEYAVRMVQFDQDAQLDRVLRRGELEPRQLDAIARLVAGFHKTIAVAGKDSDYGEPATVCHAVEENFQQIHKCLPPGESATQLEHLQAWSAMACDRLDTVFSRRKAGGFVRECHGDMHLRNLAWVDGRPLVFDCIEFNPQLRWIDVISEIAFLVMDLQDRDQARLAWRFLNSYLEDCGDYAGLEVLPFYLAYRAIVRAKVEVIRAAQPAIATDEQSAAMKEFHAYLQLANNYTLASRPVLIITRGLSASGKSTVTQALLEQLGAIRIRSDVERKRLYDVPAEIDARSGVGEGIYAAEAGRQTYEKLAELAGQVLAAGYTVIIDAAFLKTEQVTQFRKLSESTQVAFVILECTAPADILRQRIAGREKGVSDADLSVLEYQLSNWQALPEEDRAYRIAVNTEKPVHIESLIAQILAIEKPVTTI